jgi:hypothetical protein
MQNYLIAGIKIKIGFQFDHYFKNNIEAYRIDDAKSFDYKLESMLCDHIDTPKNHTTSDRNPKIIIQNGLKMIYATDLNDRVKSMIIHDEEMKHVKVLIDTTLSKNPAETEYVLLGVMFMEIAMKEGFLPIHASAIRYQDQAILFSAPSKTGKSTHANLWKKIYPEIVFINDDKPILKFVDGKMMVFGSPIAGQKAVNTNQCVPLKSIIFISQGLSDTVKRLSTDEALKLLMKNILRPTEEDNWNKILPQLEYILVNIPLYSIDATKSEHAVHAVHQALFEGEEQK